ncbi:hypothetical protein F5Y17DRAFT_465878 [Xylariaceae sp. FL0594]|nr:hypothetical protein F5Y17DRAFT_465878 [Xylariaceae sp. FL0594]
MATPTTSHPVQASLSVGGLSTELLVLILETLRDLDTTSVGVARRLSRRFNAIATPIRYQFLRLNEKIIAPRAAIEFPAGLANICAYTRQVTIDTTLDVELVRAFLDNIQNLSCIRWRCIHDGHPLGHYWKPSVSTRSQHLQIRGVKLHIEDLPLVDVDAGEPSPYAAIPTDMLESLKVAPPSPPLTARLGSLKGLLLKSSGLKALQYNDRGQGTHFVFNRDDERMPPFRELSLRSYNWNHSSAEVRRHWDFSQIRRLDLIDVPLSRFLDSVSFSDFRNLERLRLDDYSAHLPARYHQRREEVTRKQHSLIKQIRGLVELELTCHVKLFPINDEEILSRHGPRLQRLRLRDYVGFSDEERPCPTLAVEDIATLSQHLIHLRDLELDADEKTFVSSDFLRAICDFPRLRALVLHTQTVVGSSYTNSNKGIGTRETSISNPPPFRLEDGGAASSQDVDDVDRKRALYVFASLVRDKRGALASWRSVTVNVGGWKPIMMRRQSAPWRERNARGIFAERCFVMEKAEDGDGGVPFVVREVMPTLAT